jgi:hypothetical protein
MPPTLPITGRSYMRVLLLLLRTLSSNVVASPPVRVMTVMEKNWKIYCTLLQEIPIPVGQKRLK